jgi:hypothetical protein
LQPNLGAGLDYGCPTVPIFINGAIPSSVTRNGFETHGNAVLICVRYTFGAS